MVPDSHEQPPSTVGVAAPVKWSVATRIGFRFAFVYLALHIFPFPLDNFVDMPDPWEKLIPWLGRHVFHVEIVPRFCDGGDTLCGYTGIAASIAFAVLAAILWSVLDRKVTHYDALNRWFRLWVRAYLGFEIIIYGMAKVLPYQMMPPSQSALMVRLGDLSPQALLWAFMGSSSAYTRFAGLVEVLGGVLLFVPGLTTLGALISAAALTHVFVLNMSYDVNVKLHSFNLLLTSLFLLVPEFGRLANFLVLHRRVEPVNWEPMLRSRWMRGALLFIQLAFCSKVLVDAWINDYPRHKNYEALPQTVPFYGIWTVDDFVLDGQPRPPLTTDTVRWQQVIFDVPDGTDVPWDNQSGPGMAIMSMSGYRRLYWMHLDRSKNAIALMKLDDQKGPGYGPPESFLPTASLSVESPSPEVLIVEGPLDGHQIRATLCRTRRNFILRSRGFHWMNDRPFWGR